jgi:hypothetical protein
VAAILTNENVIPIIVTLIEEEIIFYIGQERAKATIPGNGMPK